MDFFHGRFRYPGEMCIRDRYWELHYGKKGICKYSKLWTYATVKNILNDTVYLGIVTQNRTGTRSYKDKAMIQKPEMEWICHEDAHEAIIDREL